MGLESLEWGRSCEIQPVGRVAGRPREPRQGLRTCGTSLRNTEIWGTDLYFLLETLSLEGSHRPGMRYSECRGLTRSLYSLECPAGFLCEEHPDEQSEASEVSIGE